jgi:hypothetical protein
VWVAASLASHPPASGSTGGPLLAGARIEPQILSIFERTCLDCHSDHTQYPWYSYVAPVSWWLQNHVSEGRNHLNLSRWDAYPMPRRQRLLSEIANQVKDGEMPLWSYTLLHREARLSAADVDAVFRWTQTERARLIAETAGANQ